MDFFLHFKEFNINIQIALFTRRYIMKKKISWLFFSLLIGGIIFTASAGSTKLQAETPTYAYTTAKSGLVIRSSPSLSGDKVGKISYGNKVQVYEKSGETMTIGGKSGKWTRIDTYLPSGYTKGWVFGGFLSDKRPSDATSYYW